MSEENDENKDDYVNDNYIGRTNRDGTKQGIKDNENNNDNNDGINNDDMINGMH